MNLINYRLDKCIHKVNETRKQTERVIMNVSGEWEKITFTGDSGAVDHVMTLEAAKAFKLNQTYASKNGLTYRAANGTPIKNYGEKHLTGLTKDNGGFKMTCQVTDVKRNLASFVKMVNEGNDIVLSKKGSYIKNPTSGKLIKLNLDNGTPTFDVWVQKVNEENEKKPIGRFGVLNLDGEADIPDEEIKDSQVSAFQRLEMSI
jgi:hypothetical protein